MTSGTWTWFWWFVFGAVTGGSAVALWLSIKDKVTLRWHEWLLGILTILLLSFTFQTFFGSIAEYETRAAWMSMLFLGIPTIIFAVIAVRSVRARLPK